MEFIYYSTHYAFFMFLFLFEIIYKYRNPSGQFIHWMNLNAIINERIFFTGMFVFTVT